MSDTLNPNLTKTAAVAAWLRERIKTGRYAAGERVPSVRALAARLSVSAFTVVQAYEQLVAEGVLSARAGSGFYVCTLHTPTVSPPAPLQPDVFDTAWLLSHLFSDLPESRAPGSGLLPASWAAYEALPSIARRIAREINAFSHCYGHIQGYAPLRESWARQLQDVGIPARTDQMLTTAGIAPAIEMVTRYLLKPGQAVAVDEPGWFWLTGALREMGVPVYGIARDAGGADVAQLRALMRHQNVRLYISNSVLHNPTGFNLSPARAYQVLNALNEFDAYLLEDDAYGALDDGHALRYAALDGFERVFYVSGVSKTLGGAWRVGVLCAPVAHMEGLLRHKMLSQMTCPELNERIVCAVMNDGGYRKHLNRLRQQLSRAHHELRGQLPQIGLAYPEQTRHGLFVWVDTGKDSIALAQTAKQDGYLLAPGQLFLPSGQASTHIRLNVACTDQNFLDWLGQTLRQSG